MDMKQLTKITLAWELYEEGVPQTHIAKRLGMHRDTVRIWIKNIQLYGLVQFIEHYEHAKKGARKRRKVTDGLKNLIYDIREQERDCCGQKIRYFLKKDHGITLGTTTIYTVLGERYQLRSKWKKNQQRGSVPQATKPREVVQMDTVDFGELFAFTAVDIFTKEVDVLLRTSLTSTDGYVFLKTAMNRRFNGYVNLIQADGGPEFKDRFKQYVLRYCTRYRVARPYKKNEQAYIESFNRSLRKECLGWSTYKTNQLSELTKEVELYLAWYHYRRPHLSLDLKPPVPDF